MIDVSRTIGSSALTLFIVACNAPPDEVTSAALPTGETATSTGSTDTPPGPTTDASATVASADGTGTSGSTTEGPATTLPLDGTTTIDPSATSGSSGDPGSSSSGMMEGSGSSGGQADCHPLLAEVLYDPMGGNNGKQWIKLYNPCAHEIDLVGASLGWGGSDYAVHGLDLEGTIAAGDCFLLGGTTVNGDTYNPVYDWAVDLSGDLEVSGDPADGIALFADIEANIQTDTVPVDAVIYGIANGSGLLDAAGATPPPHVGDAASTQSIRRTALSETWIIEPNPTPNECPTLL